MNTHFPARRQPSAGLAAGLMACCAGLLLLTIPVRLEASPPGDGILAVPGGMAAFARVLGIDDSAPGASIMLTAIRVLWEVPEGQDPVADRRRAAALRYLESLPPLEPAGAAADALDEAVPLPLPQAFWAGIPAAPAAARGPLFARLLADRRAALVYYGASALDAPTRAAVGAMPASVLYDDLRSPVFAVYGRSLRIAGGRVAVPGGPGAVRLWEAVVGASVAEPATFAARLLDRDDGRLAQLYDGVSHMVPAMQRFVLGLQDTDGTMQLHRFRQLVAAAAASQPVWHPRLRPFDRAMYDPTHLLMRTTLREDGRPAGPWFRRFWDMAFDLVASPNTAIVPRNLDAGDEPDAAWLVGLLCVPGDATARRERAEAWLFAQRVFPAPAASELTDVFLAVRGFVRARMLVLTLERMGIVNPATYAAAIRTAEAVARGLGERSWTTVAQFQGALAIIERARFNRALTAAGAEHLVRSLSGLRIDAEGDYGGAVAGWILWQLLPSAGEVVPGPVRIDPDRRVESRVIALMAGAVSAAEASAPGRMPAVEWEGLLYRVDPAGATLRRSVDVRARQGGPSLDDILALAHAVAVLAGTTAVGELEPRTAALASAVEGFDDGTLLPGAERPADWPDLRRLLAAAQRDLTGQKRTPPPEDLRRLLGPLQRAADWHLARVLVSMAYAPNLGEPDSQALLGDDPAPRHDFGLRERRPERRIQVMWAPPAEQRDRVRGWSVSGSLLGLDVALGRFALRRVASEVMPAAPAFTDAERQAFTEPVVLVSPFDYTDEARDALVAALRAGRARLAGATPDALAAAAAEAGLDEWRAAMVPWLAARDPARVGDLWSLAEIVRLGLPDTLPVTGFDAWGGSGASMDGNLVCGFPWRQPWTTLAGRKGGRMVPSLVPDLGIALAEALADRKLPARLSAGVLAVATQDLLDTIRTNHDDDWLTLVARARRIAAGRVDDYVAALTIGGPLVPADSEQPYALHR